MMGGYKLQAVAVSRPDGGVSVVRIVFEAPVQAFSVDAAAAHGFALSEDGALWARDLTDDQILAEIGRAGLDSSLPWHRVSEDDLPINRDFRDAWASDGKAVGVDMPKAREIHRERLRILRAPLLAALDIEYQRADEAGDAKTKAQIAAKKQALRDVTKYPAIEAARTPEELSAVMPAALADAGGTRMRSRGPLSHRT